MTAILVHRPECFYIHESCRCYPFSLVHAQYFVVGIFTLTSWPRRLWAILSLASQTLNCPSFYIYTPHLVLHNTLLGHCIDENVFVVIFSKVVLKLKLFKYHRLLLSPEVIANTSGSQMSSDVIRRCLKVSAAVSWLPVTLDNDRQ